MTATKQKIKRRKLRKSIIIFSIIFCTLFSGFIPLIDLPVGENNDLPNTWFNPHLADYLYEDDVNSTSYNFNAMNESYIMCKIRNIDYTDFSLNGTQ